MFLLVALCVFALPVFVIIDEDEFWMVWVYTSIQNKRNWYLLLYLMLIQSKNSLCGGRKNSKYTHDKWRKEKNTQTWATQSYFVCRFSFFFLCIFITKRTRNKIQKNVKSKKKCIQEKKKLKYNNNILDVTFLWLKFH